MIVSTGYISPETGVVEAYECSRAERGSNYIKLFDDNEDCIIQFIGISDFSSYSIEGGEWDTASAEIGALKKKLVDTDYVVIKIAEGSATAEEYADMIMQRQQWRDRINELGG